MRSTEHQSTYQCPEASISGSEKITVFNQAENIPEHKDDIDLSKLIIKFTVVSSVQLSNLFLQQILKFNSTELNFNISENNTRLVSLFLLATMHDQNCIKTKGFRTL